MIVDVAKGIRIGAIGHSSLTKFEDLSGGGKTMYNAMAKAAIIAALPHIKEAMEYHGVEGAMNKMIIKRLEEQCR